MPSRKTFWLCIGLCSLASISASVYLRWQPIRTAKPVPVRRVGLQDDLYPEDTPVDSVDQIDFNHKTVRERFLKTDQLVRQMPETWTRQPGRMYGNTQWDRHSLRAIWIAPGRSITINTTKDHDGNRGYSLQASTAPKHGWGAMIDYRQWAYKLQLTQQLSLCLVSPNGLRGNVDKKMSESSPHLVVSYGDSSYMASYKDSKFLYECNVGNPNNFDQDTTPEEVADYWESPNSFRHMARIEILRLHELGVEGIQSSEAFLIERNRQRDGGDPPQFFPPIGEVISDAIKEQAVKEFENEIERRLQLVETDFVEMHQALMVTFPAMLEIVMASPSGE